MSDFPIGNFDPYTLGWYPDRQEMKCRICGNFSSAQTCHNCGVTPTTPAIYKYRMLLSKLAEKYEQLCIAYNVNPSECQEYVEAIERLKKQEWEP